MLVRRGRYGAGAVTGAAVAHVCHLKVLDLIELGHRRTQTFAHR